ncbi:unnamed protein product [Vitrella brassicaformis CCMP3155]|uniref:Uncharacterized protein n=2 Tax=Vitrella brassicaformis TaxID=1169539 RepID=A0A0G4FGQ1_VITBC|nr:unnamed protein product [Vitrella brassicaformis CCMP3155]|eukprot:CEM12622.1 unnamed protein product [Vitrella brassicaformis CCMP3155]
MHQVIGRQTNSKRPESAHSSENGTPSPDHSRLSALPPLADSDAAAPSSPAEKEETPTSVTEGGGASEAYWRLFPLALTLGAGQQITITFFQTSVGYFQGLLKSNKVLLFFVLTNFLPAPLMISLQIKYDSVFDQLYGTDSTYLFRTSFVTIVAGVVCFCAGFADTWAGVLTVGILLGCLTSALLSSSQQLLATGDSKLPAVVKLGTGVAAGTTVLVTKLSGFKPDASRTEILIFLAVPLIVTTFCVVIYGVFHCTHQLRAIYDLILEGSDESPRSGRGEYTRQMDSGTLSGSGLGSPTPAQHLLQPSLGPRYESRFHLLPPSLDREATITLWLLGICLLVNRLCLMSLMPFLAFFGGPIASQDLLLSKLVGDFLGNLMSILINPRQVAKWLHRAMPPVMVTALLAMEMTIFAWMVLDPISACTKEDVLDPRLVALVIIYYLIGGFTENAASVFAGAAVPSPRRPDAIRFVAIGIYTGLSIGLVGATIAIYAHPKFLRQA